MINELSDCFFFMCHERMKLDLLLLILIFHFQAEGIFRINPENDQEEQVRDQLNKGVVPEDIEVHCLASLIKVGHLSARNNYETMFQLHFTTPNISRT